MRCRASLLGGTSTKCTPQIDFVGDVSFGEKCSNPKTAAGFALATAVREHARFHGGRLARKRRLRSLFLSPSVLSVRPQLQLLLRRLRLHLPGSRPPSRSGPQTQQISPLRTPCSAKEVGFVNLVRIRSVERSYQRFLVQGQRWLEITCRQLYARIINLPSTGSR